MAGRNTPGSGGFDASEKLNSNTLKRHPKMDLTRNDLLQLLSYLEGELQARDVVIATLKAEKAKQLLYQAKYGRFGLGDPFSAMQRDSDNMKDNTFDESAIKLMYDNQLAQLENLIATQRKAQMKMREQMVVGEKKFHKVCAELDDEKRKHAQDTAQGDDVTYALEKERERLKQEVDFEKGNAKKMEKDLKKTLASLEEERANSAKHKQVALMLIKERKKVVEKMLIEKQRADHYEKAYGEEKGRAMNMAEGLVQESKKSLKMEATMERQLSEFDLEREQMKNKLLREEKRTKDLQSQVESLMWQLENVQKPSGKSPKEAYHSVEIKSQLTSPQLRLSSERTQAWQSPSASSPSGLSHPLSGRPGGESSVEREAGLSPRNSQSEQTVRKRDNSRYASPQPSSLERVGMSQNDGGLEPRVAPVGAVSDRGQGETQGGSKYNVSSMSGGNSMVVSGGSRINVQTGSPTLSSGPVSPRRMLSVGRGVPPPIPPNKPVLTTQLSKPSVSSATASLQKQGATASRDSRVAVSSTGMKPVHIPISVVHTATSSSAASGNRTPNREGSPTTMRKPAQFSDSLPHPLASSADDAGVAALPSDSFDFLGPEMDDLQKLLVSMVTDSPDTPRMKEMSSSSSHNPFSISSPKSQSTYVSNLQISPSSQSSSSPSLSVPSLSSSLTSSLLSPSSPSSSIGAAVVSPNSMTSFSLSSSMPPMSLSFSSSKIPLPTSSVASLPTVLPVNSSTLTSTQSAPSLPPRSTPASPTVTMPMTSRIPVASTMSGVRDRHSLALPLAKSAEMPTSPIHRYSAQGNLESLRKLVLDLDADVNLPMKDGTTPAHCAAEHGQFECLKLLIERGCHINCHRDDQFTPVHCAAVQGFSRCLELLLSNGGNVDVYDNHGWTALHWAANNGHTQCCRLLLEHGASRTALSSTSWTPCHTAVHSGYASIVDLLLTFTVDQSDNSIATVRQDICSIVDKDGWTLAHLAASKESQDCLSVILTYCDIDTSCYDNWGRSVLDVASTHCRTLLMACASKDRLHSVTIEMCCTGPLYSQQQPFIIGQIHLHPSIDWPGVDAALIALVERYFRQLENGLRTKKTTRLDPEGVVDESLQFQLGLTRDSICNFSIGLFSWTPGGMYPDIAPQDTVCNNNMPKITVSLHGSEQSYDSLAFDLLFPVSAISNYIRLLEQYKNVVFYGPQDTRKKLLVKRLARYVADKEKVECGDSRVTQVYLHRDFSHWDLVQLLKSEGCLLPIGQETERACILQLFHMEKVPLAQVLGGLLSHIDYRGSKHPFNILGADNIHETFYFNERFYLIATMDKPRSTGLDLGLQQRFRWVHIRINEEPVRNLLARYLLRRLMHTFDGELPSSDNPVFKAVEWLVCVWQRLNDGLGKLGLPDIVFGPEIFLPCPLETRQAQTVLEWIKKLWNETISPAVRAAVQRGKENTGDSHQKVASTALYVLLQRAIVPGCPLSGEEKDLYLSQFSGTNDLDVPLKADKTSPTVASIIQRRPVINGSGRNHSDNLRPVKHRNSLGNEGPAHLSSVNTSVKRRSLSENAFERSERIEIPIVHHQRPEMQTLKATKVPKLEIRSPVLGLSTPSFSSSSSFSSSAGSESPGHHRRSTFSAHSRVLQAQASSKRSRSSESLNYTNRSPRGSTHFQPTSPFSFSLTTPTSTLFSFKFLDREAMPSTENL